MPEFKQSNKKKKKNMSRVTRPTSPTHKKNQQSKNYEKHKNTSRTSSQGNKNYRSNQKKARKKARNKQNRIIYYIMFIFMFAVIVSILSVTVLFNLETVSVEGESVYTDEEIIAAAQIEDGVNLIRYNSHESEQALLSKLVYLDGAKIRKDYPSKLTIVIEGAERMYNIALSDGECLIVSKRGRILEKTRQADNNILVHGYEPVSENLGDFAESQTERKTEQVVQIIEEIEKNKLENIIDIDINDYLNISLNYGNRIKLVIGTASNLPEKLLIAKGLLENEIGENEFGTLNLITPTKVRFLPDTAGENSSIFENEPEETEPEVSSDIENPENTNNGEAPVE